MKRVASLYLPHWSIDRVVRAERRTLPPPDAPPVPAAPPPRPAERITGWRPGARWAKGERVAARPTMAHAAPPLVTVQRSANRVEIAAASPAAAALGIAPGMALTQARASVPSLDVRDADPAGDHADLTRLAEALARRWSPHVAITDADGLMLDLTGVAHLHGGEERMARQLVRLLARLGFGARIAIADTVGAAWALARYGDALIRDHLSPVPPSPRACPGVHRASGAEQEAHAVWLGSRWTPGQARGDASYGARDALNSPVRPELVEGRPRLSNGRTPFDKLRANGSYACISIIPPATHRTALAPLPVAALRLDGDALELLERFGIATIGELLAMPRAPLVRRFGAAIVRRLDQATGALAEPLIPIVPDQPISVERRFAEPIATTEAITHWLEGLTRDLATELARAGLGARALLFVAGRVDHQAQGLRIGFARATRDARHIQRLIARRIEEIDPGYGIEALTLHVRRAEPLGAQALGAALAEDSTPDLAPLVDALANRIGHARLWRHRPVESDVPERAVAAIPPLDPPADDALRLKLDDVRQLDQRPADHPWHPRWPRPARLLARPEPLDHVVAELPDQPPRRFTWRGERHQVVRGDGPERITGEWWRRGAERDAVRDYFRVEDEEGRRFWLFRRGDGVQPETGDLSWFIHGTFG